MAPALLDADQLKTLVAIADTGSFTRAASDVNKTQAAVSMQMRRLEETAGRRLFVKNGRQNRLTPDGQHLLDYARRIIRLNNEAMALLNEPELAGFVRIGTPDDYAERFLPPIFAGFSRTHPFVVVVVACESSSALMEKIHEGKIDLAIATHKDCGSHGEVIRRERLCWVTSPRHKVEEMDTIPLALGAANCSWRADATQALDQVKRPHRILYSSPSAAALTAAVLSGLAISVLPESAVRPGMRRLAGDEGFPELPHCDIALLRAPANQSSSVDALADHIVESLTNLDFSSQSWA
jgi:DNA-binding transcriptional LysR family regulator